MYRYIDSWSLLTIPDSYIQRPAASVNRTRPPAPGPARIGSSCQGRACAKTTTWVWSFFTNVPDASFQFEALLPELQNCKNGQAASAASFHLSHQLVTLP